MSKYLNIRIESEKDTDTSCQTETAQVLPTEFT